jgi:hypothetical protein
MPRLVRSLPRLQHPGVVAPCDAAKVNIDLLVWQVISNAAVTKQPDRLQVHSVDNYLLSSPQLRAPQNRILISSLLLSPPPASALGNSSGLQISELYELDTVFYTSFCFTKLNMTTNLHADPPPPIVREPHGIQYITDNRLGKGGFAICYRGEQCDGTQRTGKIVALKIVKSRMEPEKLAQKVSQFIVRSGCIA